MLNIKWFIHNRQYAFQLSDYYKAFENWLFGWCDSYINNKLLDKNVGLNGLFGSRFFILG